MRNKKYIILFLFVLLSACLSTILKHQIVEQSKMNRLRKDTVTTDGFRGQDYESSFLTYLQSIPKEAVPKTVGIYLLETNFGADAFAYPLKAQTFITQKEQWDKSPWYTNYMKAVDAVWEDITYFPVPVSTRDEKLTVHFTNSWMTERTYGGKRGHEGTDIMASKNKTGLYPLVSMTDGVVRKKGWLEKGGYRLLIEAPSGACFYYAHMDSYANIAEGSEIKAGQLIGFMGDTGYGKVEGTRGKFAVHLHLGIYLYIDDREISINPYNILTFIKNHKLKYAYS